MNKDIALRLALEALESTGENDGYHGVDQYFDNVLVDKAITALRLAIDKQNMASKSTYKEQLEAKDEFVAWEQFYPDIGKPQIAFNAEVVGYVAPQRTWVGLTKMELIKCGVFPWGNSYRLYEAIEDKLKQKNT